MAMPQVCGLGTRELQLWELSICWVFPCKLYSPLKISFVCFFLLKKTRNKEDKLFLNLLVASPCGYFVIHFPLVVPGMFVSKKCLIFLLIRNCQWEYFSLCTQEWTLPSQPQTSQENLYPKSTTALNCYSPVQSQMEVSCKWLFSPCTIYWFGPYICD